MVGKTKEQKLKHFVNNGGTPLPANNGVHDNRDRDCSVRARIRTKDEWHAVGSPTQNGMYNLPLSQIWVLRLNPLSVHPYHQHCDYHTQKTRERENVTEHHAQQCECFPRFGVGGW